jgi:hypothetical protein
MALWLGLGWLVLRPSWRLFKRQGLPWDEIRQHRRMYPSSKFRKRFVAAVISMLALLLGMFIGAASFGQSSKNL